MRHKNGEWLDILPRAFLVVRGGTVTRVVGTNVDITERKESERSLRRLNEILVEGSEALPVGVAFYDPDLRLVMWNRLYAQMQPQCTGALAPGAQFADILEAAQGGADRGDIDARLVQARLAPQDWVQTLADGRTIAHAVIPTNGDDVVAVIEDITA